MLSGICEDGTTVRLTPEFSIVSGLPELSNRKVLWAGSGAFGSLTPWKEAATRPAGLMKLTPIRRAHAPTVNATSRGSNGSHSKPSIRSRRARDVATGANQRASGSGERNGGGRLGAGAACRSRSN